MLPRIPDVFVRTGSEIVTEGKSCFHSSELTVVRLKMPRVLGPWVIFVLGTGGAPPPLAFRCVD